MSIAVVIPCYRVRAHIARRHRANRAGGEHSLRRRRRLPGQERRSRREHCTRSTRSRSPPRDQPGCRRRRHHRLSRSARAMAPTSSSRSTATARWIRRCFPRFVHADRRGLCRLHQRQSLLRRRFGTADAGGAACSATPACRSCPSCRPATGTSSIRPTAIPLSIAACWRRCRSTRSARATSSSPTCCSGWARCARVLDIPMRPFTATRKAALSVRHAALEFGVKHLRNFGKRIVYNYFLRNFSFASIELVRDPCCSCSASSSAS